MKVGDLDVPYYWWSGGFTATFSYVADPCASAHFNRANNSYVSAGVLTAPIGTSSTFSTS